MPKKKQPKRMPKSKGLYGGGGAGTRTQLPKLTRTKTIKYYAAKDQMDRIEAKLDRLLSPGTGAAGGCSSPFTCRYSPQLTSGGGGYSGG